MAAETAVVEVLTAEVRVLMVGSRQVTLSVAKQLDHVELEKIDAFGRIRFPDKDKIIGRSQKDGTLVLANFESFPRRTPFIDECDLDPTLDAKPVVCARNRLEAAGYGYALKYHDRSIVLSTRAAEACDAHALYQPGKCKFWQVNGHDRHIYAAIDAWDANCAIHDQAAALPLIVLAGLR